MFQGIDLSSDTATLPSLAMKRFMLDAPVGDEQKGEDPTTKQLERMAATLFGFDDAVFLPSATMANQIAICALAKPGDVLLAAENAHLFLAESGGPAVHARVLSRSILTSTGLFTIDDIKQHEFSSKGLHHPSISIISLENTTNFGGGYAWSQTELRDIVAYAKKSGINMHLDGARIFNASIKTSLSVQEITSGFDTITVCLSKGLGCPIGALLIFNDINKLKIQRLKKMMGGAMRQSGIIAAAGIYALQNNIDRLKVDHEHAHLFATELTTLADKIHIINNPPATNMVFFQWRGKNTSTAEFLNQCIQNGVRFSDIGSNRLRAVTHLNISHQNIMHTIKILREICNKID